MDLTEEQRIKEFQDEVLDLILKKKFSLHMGMYACGGICAVIASRILSEGQFRKFLKDLKTFYLGFQERLNDASIQG